VFGADSDVVKSGRVATVQAIGGTGGLKIGADFLKKLSPHAKVLISDPSWENHRALFRTPALRWAATLLRRRHARRQLRRHAGRLNAAAPGTIVVLHACCHNPTGYDLTAAQWDQVIAAVKAARA
jgi:aromatic-amino-acid transaminase